MKHRFASKIAADQVQEDQRQRLYEDIATVTNYRDASIRRALTSKTYDGLRPYSFCYFRGIDGKRTIVQPH